MISQYEAPTTLKGERMKAILMGLMFLVTSVTSQAAMIEIEASFSLSGEAIELDSQEAKAQGWQIKKDRHGDDSYYMKIKVPSSKLPITKNLGEAQFGISAKGVVDLGVSIGDADSTSSTYLYLPMSGANLVPLPAPLTLVNSSGDGAYSFNGELKIKVTPR